MESVSGVCTTLLSEIISDDLSKNGNIFIQSKNEVYEDLPPPQAYRRIKSTDSAAGDQLATGTPSLEQSRAWIHIRNYNAAVGQEIQQSEPGRWSCDASELHFCAIRASDLIRKTLPLRLQC